MNSLITVTCFAIAVIINTASTAICKDVEDLISVQIIDKRVIAINQARHIASIDLALQENVQWHGAMGNLGAVLTSKRLLAISSSFGGWREYPLWLEERSRDDVLISENLVLLVTEKQMIIFDSRTNQWASEPFPIHDVYFNAAIDQHISVVITSKRAFGYAAGGRTFEEVHFRKGEEYKALTIQSRDATLRTNRRLLIFSSSISSWREIDLQ